MESEVDVQEMLVLQLAEVEMLLSMFPNSGEFELDDPACVTEIQSHLDGELPYDAVQARLGFTIKLEIEVDTEKVLVELVCLLPHEYPSVMPDIFLRAPTIGKVEHEKMATDLKSYLKDLDRGEICVGPLVEWINENTHAYVRPRPEKSSKEIPVKKHDNKFTRMWIYSHHMYSKIKRRDILDYSAELQLTGFSMPGKPGMVVIEGYSDCVEEFWRRVRNMTWKKITMKEKEDSDIEVGKSVDNYRKFDNFEEKNFDARAGRGRGVHMNLGQLYQYLEERGCGTIFNLFFGVNGTLAPEED